MVVVVQVAMPEPFRGCASHPVIPRTGEGHGAGRARTGDGGGEGDALADREGLTEETTPVAEVTSSTVWFTVPKLVSLLVSPL